MNGDNYCYKRGPTPHVRAFIGSQGRAWFSPIAVSYSIYLIDVNILKRSRSRSWFGRLSRSLGKLSFLP